jgi:CDP-paratose 2-epimerase
MRADFFGPAGDTRWNLQRIREKHREFTHFDIDVRDRSSVSAIYKEHRFDVTIHCAAQPSHDLAARRPFDDFDTNAVGTLNLLEGARQHAPESPFLFMSTNKVYGDAPNELPLREHEKRWDYANEQDWNGVKEDMRIDQSKHSLFGASKLAADILVQEYGRYFGMPTVCYRGGCLTGPNHSGVELHGFISYLVKVVMRGDVYKIFGYKGKQVRDQIHSYDVVRAFEEFIANPRSQAVYNLGGGRGNSVSILECFDLLEQLTGKKARYEYLEQPRQGDHICYVSDTRRLENDYPRWRITRNLIAIFEEIVKAETESSHKAVPQSSAHRNAVGHSS